MLKKQTTVKNIKVFIIIMRVILKWMKSGYLIIMPTIFLSNNINSS